MTARPVSLPRRLVRRVARPIASRIRRWWRRYRGRRDPAGDLAPRDTRTMIRIPVLLHAPELDAQPRLVVLMPHLELKRMTGGPNTIFTLTARLAAAGIPVRYVAALGRADSDVARLESHIARVAGLALPAGSVEFDSVGAPARPLRVGANDVFLATWWPTAHIAREALAHTRADEFLYLVQDFEPAFYPWSTNYALALATYQFPIRAVFNERLLRDHFRAQSAGRLVGAEAARLSTAFDPAVDRSVFRPRVERRAPGRRRRLLFYARPSNARNGFELGMMALRLAAERGAFDAEAWDLCFIGHKVAPTSLTPRHVIRPTPWLGFAEYGNLLGSSDLLLSIMLSPHTSYPPLEMAAAGGRVVTNTWGVKTEDVLHALSPAITAVPPSVDDLADALVRCARELAAGSTDGEGQLALPETWDEALAETTPWLIEQIRDIAGWGPGG